MQPTTKRLVTEASVAGHVVANLPVRLGESALSATYGPKGSVYVASYLTAGATAAQNVTAINAAITAAVTDGLDVCFDGVVCSINAELNLTASVRLWASTAAACHITQTVAGQAVFYVKADGVTLDGFTLTGTLTDTGTKMDMHNWTGDPHLLSAIKVDRGIDRLTVNRIKGSNWFAVLAGFPYPFSDTSTPAINYQFITNLSVNDVEVEKVWAAVRMSGLKNATYRNVRGSYKPVINHVPGGVSADTAPPHLFYITNVTETTDVPRAWNEDVKLYDCHAQDGWGGAAFSLRYTKGMTWANLTADNCEGLFDMIGVHGFTGTGWHSTRDNYPRDNVWNGNRGSAAMLYCNDGVINPGVIEGAADFQHGSILYVGVCERVSIIEPRGWIDNVTPDGALPGAYLSGRNVRVVRPYLESRGASVSAGISLQVGFNSQESTVTVERPVTKGAWLRGVDVQPTTTKQTVIYDPDELESIDQDVLFAASLTQAAAPNLINTKYGYPPAQDARVIGWHHGEKLEPALRIRWPSGHVSNIHTDAWVGNAPYLSANATVTGLLCADFGTPDVDLACQVKYGAGSVGLALRAIDTSNFLHVVLTSTSVVLAKRVAGTYTTLVTTPLDVATAGVWHDIRVRAIGSRIIVRVDGAQAISHTLAGGDETTFATASSHGLRSDAGGANSGWYGLQVRKVS